MSTSAMVDATIATGTVTTTPTNTTAMGMPSMLDTGRQASSRRSRPGARHQPASPGTANSTAAATSASPNPNRSKPSVNAG